MRSALRSRIVAIAGTSGDLAAILSLHGSPLPRQSDVGYFGFASSLCVGPLALERGEPGGATDGRQGVIVPSTSGSLVEAWLPVMVVLSMLAVPKLAMPPPTPALNRSVAPGWPGVATPLMPKGEFRLRPVAPPPAPPCPPDPARA